MNFIDCYHKHLSSENYILPFDYNIKIEEKAELMSSLMGRQLTEQHGPVLDFSYLLRPFYYFYLFAYANGSYLKPEGGNSENALQPILNINKLSEMPVNGWAHEILYKISKAEDPLQYSLKLLERIPRYERTSGTDKNDKDMGGENIESYVGISLSLVVLEKLTLWLMSGRKLRFVRARKPDREHHLLLDPALRSGLLEALSDDTEVCQLANEEYRLLLSSVMFMPTYFLEDFDRELAVARDISRNLAVLVCGIEFQHKPAIAIALALLKKQGSRLIGSQHGGAYGQTDISLMERTERFLFDDYITWGHQFYANEHPLPSIRLSRFRFGPLWQRFRRRMVKPERKTILIVLPYIKPALAYGSNRPNILQQHVALLKSLEILSSAINENYKIILRMHPWNDVHEYEQAIPDFMRDRVPLVHGQRGTLARDMHNYEYVMFTGPNATGLSECVVNGVPFTIIARPECYRIRPEAEHIYETLRQADVWVTEPEQLTRVLKAKKTNDRQKAALDLFGKMYAFHTYAYLGHWSRFINSLNSGQS